MNASLIVARVMQSLKLRRCQARTTSQRQSINARPVSFRFRRCHFCYIFLIEYPEYHYRAIDSRPFASLRLPAISVIREAAAKPLKLFKYLFILVQKATAPPCLNKANSPSATVLVANPNHNANSIRIECLLLVWLLSLNYRCGAVIFP